MIPILIKGRKQTQSEFKNLLRVNGSGSLEFKSMILFQSMYWMVIYAYTDKFSNMNFENPMRRSCSFESEVANWQFMGLFWPSEIFCLLIESINFPFQLSTCKNTQISHKNLDSQLLQKNQKIQQSGSLSLHQQLLLVLSKWCMCPVLFVSFSADSYKSI